MSDIIRNTLPEVNSVISQISSQTSLPLQARSILEKATTEKAMKPNKGFFTKVLKIQKVKQLYNILATFAHDEHKPRSGSPHKPCLKHSDSGSSLGSKKKSHVKIDTRRNKIHQFYSPRTDENGFLVDVESAPKESKFKRLTSRILGRDDIQDEAEYIPAVGGISSSGAGNLFSLNNRSIIDNSAINENDDDEGSVVSYDEEGGDGEEITENEKNGEDAKEEGIQHDGGKEDVETEIEEINGAEAITQSSESPLPISVNATEIDNDITTETKVNAIATETATQPQPSTQPVGIVYQRFANGSYFMECFDDSDDEDEEDEEYEDEDEERSGDVIQAGGKESHAIKVDDKAGGEVTKVERDAGAVDGETFGTIKATKNDKEIAMKTGAAKGFSMMVKRGLRRMITCGGHDGIDA